MTSGSLFVNDTVEIPFADVKMIKKQMNVHDEVSDITIYVCDNLTVVLKREDAIRFITEYHAWWD